MVFGFLISFGFNFGFYFIGVLDFLGVFWELLRPLEAFLRGLCSQKPLKNLVFFKVFDNEGFGFFEAFDGSFWFILASLCRSDP